MILDKLAEKLCIMFRLVDTTVVNDVATSNTSLTLPQEFARMDQVQIAQNIAQGTRVPANTVTRSEQLLDSLLQSQITTAQQMQNILAVVGTYAQLLTAQEMKNIPAAIATTKSLPIPSNLQIEQNLVKNATEEMQSLRELQNIGLPGPEASQFLDAITTEYSGSNAAATAATAATATTVSSSVTSTSSSGALPSGPYTIEQTATSTRFVPKNTSNVSSAIASSNAIESSDSESSSDEEETPQQREQKLNEIRRLFLDKASRDEARRKLLESDL
jgi:hypothetical protein